MWLSQTFPKPLLLPHLLVTKPYLSKACFSQRGVSRDPLLHYIMWRHYVAQMRLSCVCLGPWEGNHRDSGSFAGHSRARSHLAVSHVPMVDGRPRFWSRQRNELRGATPGWRPVSRSRPIPWGPAPTGGGREPKASLASFHRFLISS